MTVTPGRMPVGALYQYAAMLATPISTGWPELDCATGGLHRPRVIGIVGEPIHRRQLLHRISAWVAGDGYGVVHIDTARHANALALSIFESGAGTPALGPMCTVPDSAQACWRSLRLACSGVGSSEDDLATALASSAPVDLLVLDGARDTHAPRIAHTYGASVLVGSDAIGTQVRDAIWRVHRPRGTLVVDVTEDPTGTRRQVQLREPPGDRHPDLVTRAGHVNAFRVLSRGQ